MRLIELLALAVSFIVGVLLCPIFIPFLRKAKFGQYIREEGPEAHLKKSGTPTMGGIMILLAFGAGALIFAGSFPRVVPLVIGAVFFGLIGLCDDVLKITKRQSEGLKAWQKFGLQIIVAVVMLLFIGLSPEYGTGTFVPFAGFFELGGWFYPIGFLAIMGTVNGANFTDGLDGLAGTVTIVIAMFFACASVLLDGGLTPAALAMLGSLLAFLIYNAYPAKVFMGDTGSLALGGFVCGMALMLKMPIFLIIVAFVYLVEIISVILQVGYFKLTHGKRLFKMAPIHHHFELCGWHEVRVVTVFAIVTFILCVIGFIGLYLAVLIH
ncbi:MAG: phospho-N-acetylmuramoyl-pentapeptide-transferase [Parasporobacterium sp.]|nr:phospho-N-acetylmuramoyl-pentapeptide-transferase [Parasporobacterium sp.]